MTNHISDNTEGPAKYENKVLHIVPNIFPTIKQDHLPYQRSRLTKQSVYILRSHLNGLVFSSVFSCWAWPLSGLELSFLM